MLKKYCTTVRWSAHIGVFRGTCGGGGFNPNMKILPIYQLYSVLRPEDNVKTAEAVAISYDLDLIEK